MSGLISAGLLTAATVQQGCNLATGHMTPRPAEEPSTCMATADGMMTLSLYASLIEIANPGQPAGTFQPGMGLELIDSHCNVVGAYSWDKCGIPAIIQEDFLPQVLTIHSVSADVGTPEMSFTYGDTSYDTNSSPRCKCWKAPNGLEAKAFCTCEFVLSGTNPPYFTGPNPGIVPPPRKSKRAPRVASEMKTEGQ